MYFKYFNTFPYSLKDREYQFVDIFKRISFSNKSKNNKKIFSDYYVVDGDTAESIAKKFYNDPSLSWLVLTFNNFLNQNEFPLSLDKIENNARQRYPGNSLYFYEFMQNIKPGDVLVKCTVSGNEITSFDTTKYAVVQEYNSVFRYIIIRQNYGLEENDFVCIKRLDGSDINDVVFDVQLEQDELPIGRNFAQIKKITDAIDSPVEFLNSNLNYVSPYYINDLNEAKSSSVGIYDPFDLTDTNTVKNTNINSYILGSGTFSTKTIFDNYVEENNRNRIIKLINPRYLNDAFLGFQELIFNDNIRIKNIEIER
jgi:hypothetical protein